MAEETEEKASMVQVKQIIRRKLRRIPPFEEQALNIYPLMDVMTILLVFMIMQFAAETSQVMQSAELQIPYSTSEADLESALSVTISRTEISVDGNQVLTLRNGIVDPSHKQGGGTGFLITPLHNVMIRQRDTQKALEQATAGQRPFTGTVQIIADKRTPFRTLSEVIYTLGQAEFSNLHFVVLQHD
ncbi:MAG TPA: biopolymer transporter ExbD [Sandaracinaceae bacterium LLY-WYZ-13_1]|nr:biopolymer transporter ExbD [Sandaracinaceae bacterium LLY-WYZ-13_1]